MVVAIIGTPSPLQALARVRSRMDVRRRLPVRCWPRLPARRRLSTAKTRHRLAKPRGSSSSPGSRNRPPPRPRPPRARRAITLDPASPGAAPQTAAEFLACVPLFAELEPALQAELAGQGAHDAGSRPASGCSAKATPATRCTSSGRGDSRSSTRRTGAVIRELGRGDALGELALLTDSPRSASVRAARATDLIAIDRPDFEALLHSSPALSRVAQPRARRDSCASVRAPESSARPRPTTVALVSLDDRVPIAALAGDLCAALQHYASTGLLVRSRARRSGRRTRDRVYGPLLDRAEAAHELVLLDGGSAPDGEPWTEFCLQQADRILAVTGGGPVPEAARGSPGAARLRSRRLRRRPRIGRAGGLGGGARTDRVTRRPGHRTRRRPGARGPAPQRSLDRHRALGRRRASVLPHRGARGADGRRGDDRPRRGREHGRVRRGAVRDGPRRRGDRRALLRGVGSAPPAGRLHAATPLADPRRPRRGDAAPRSLGRSRSRSWRAASSAAARNCAAGDWSWLARARCGRASASACASR